MYVYIPHDPAELNPHMDWNELQTNPVLSCVSRLARVLASRLPCNTSAARQWETRDRPESLGLSQNIDGTQGIGPKGPATNGLSIRYNKQMVL